MLSLRAIKGELCRRVDDDRVTFTSIVKELFSMPGKIIWNIKQDRRERAEQNRQGRDNCATLSNLTGLKWHCTWYEQANYMRPCYATFAPDGTSGYELVKVLNQSLYGEGYANRTFMEHGLDCVNAKGRPMVSIEESIFMKKAFLPDATPETVRAAVYKTVTDCARKAQVRAPFKMTPV